MCQLQPTSQPQSIKEIKLEPAAHQCVLRIRVWVAIQTRHTTTNLIYIGQLSEYAYTHHFDNSSHIFTVYGDALIKLMSYKPCQIVRCIEELYGAVWSRKLTHTSDS